MQNSIKFNLIKYGCNDQVDENDLPLYLEPDEPNRELVKLQKCGVPKKENKKTLSTFWNRMKDTAMLKTGKEVKCEKTGKAKVIKRPPTIKQINQRLGIFKAKFNKPDILDLFDREELNQIMSQGNEKSKKLTCCSHDKESSNDKSKSKAEIRKS